MKNSPLSAFLARSLVSCLALSSALLAIQASAAPDEEAPPELSEAEFQRCLRQLQAAPAFKGISAQTFERYALSLTPDATVLPLLKRQPEFTLPPWDYIAMLVDAERLADGRAAAGRWQAELAQIASQSGVPAPVILGVWGVESNFGQNLGGRPLLRSLGTLSCFGRRQEYFRSEFAAALRIVQEGHIAADRLNGSWAGAFGHTQFMPSIFLRSAVDFDGDGRRDLMDSVPDALASTARFLKNAGWRSGQPWGYEVRLPPGYDASRYSRKTQRSTAEWAQDGLTLPDGSPLPFTLAKAGLIQPARKQGGGPAFLVGGNFNALYSYNASENYALSIARLADLLAQPQTPADDALASFATPWPTDDPGLTRAQNRELQTLLLARGHAIGSADGRIGPQTREAIRAEQARLGQPVTGRAGQKLLRALQAP